MGKEYQPLPVGSDYTQRGDTIVDLYMSSNFLGEFESNEYGEIEKILYSHAALLGKVQVDTNWYMGMQETAMLRRALMNRRDIHAALAKEPYNPIKQIEYADALQGERALNQRAGENRNNLSPGYGEAEAETHILWDELKGIFLSLTEENANQQSQYLSPEEKTFEVFNGLTSLLQQLAQETEDGHSCS